MANVEMAAHAAKAGPFAPAAPGSYRALPALAATAGALLGSIAILAAGPQNVLLTAVAALAGILLAACALALLGYRRSLAAIHRAVREAHDGVLAPIVLDGPSRAMLGSLADDYDALARNLGSLFRNMEQAQLAIICERNRHDAILRSLPGALLIVDIDFRVTRANLQAEALFGLRPDATLDGADVFDLLRTDGAGRDILREAFLYERPVRNTLLTVAVAGDQRWISVNVTFFKQSQDAPESCAAIILQDMTDYKRLEELTLQSEKLVAMGQLAAGVAHELNTPLGTILGYAQLLKEGRAGEERRAEYAESIHGEARRCARIIDNLLAYARHDGCHPESCDIGELAHEAAEAVANCQGRRLGVPIEANGAGAVTVAGSSGQLDIVLVNLLVNAVQAASAADEPRVRISCSVEGGFGVVAVVDNGPGVPEQNRFRIFDPFFTTKAESTGTGLGLAISHSIVTRIGGTLLCDPAYRGGARFVLTLPLAQ